MRKAIFLDRDGTVIRAVARPEIGPEAIAWAPWYLNEVNFEPYLREAVKIFKDLGYLVIVATNQPDVAYGNISEGRWKKIQDTVMAEVQPDAIYVCRHTTADRCPEKKPAPGMLIRAAKEMDLNLAESFMIGDTEKDTLAGKAAGCKTILIRRHYNFDNREANENADYIVNSLLETTVMV